MVARGHITSAKRARPAAGAARRTGQKELREFRFQPKSGSGGSGGSGSFSRWTRILLVIAVVQATVGICFWFFTPVDDQQIHGPLNLTAFADPNLPIVDLKTRPNDIAVVVMASGQRPEALRQCLQSLSHADGHDPESILVAQASPGIASQHLAQREFGLDWFGPADTSGDKGSIAAPKTITSGIRAAGHFKRALEYAAHRKFMFRRYRSVMVVEEDMVFAPDILWYFVQLEKLLHSDSSLWCITAWNDNGRAAYVADPTIVMRTDWFSGLGWLVRLELLRSELLKEWPETGRWQDWLRARGVQQGKQCLYPEIPRLAFSGLSCTAELSVPDDSGYVSNDGCTAEEAFTRQLSMFTVMSSSVGVNLGDLERLKADKYRELFLSTWPGKQGLLHASSITTVADLEVRLEHDLPPDPQKAMTPPRQPLLMVVSHVEKEEESGHVMDTWESVAEYFGLAPGGLRCQYEGVVRLWWRDTTLYLALDSSPLVANLKSYHLRRPRARGADFERRARNNFEPQPLPVPPLTVVAGAPTGLSCAQYCSSLRHTCIDADIASVASCRAPLTSVFQCQHCLKKIASPAYPGLNRDTEQCVAMSPLSGAAALPVGDCAAKSARVRRLCVCRTQSGPIPIRLQSAARYFVQRTGGQKDVAQVIDKAEAPVSSKRAGAFPGTLHQQIGAVNSQVVSEVSVNVFSPEPSSLSSGAKPRTEFPPERLSIVLLAIAERRQNTEDLSELRATLRSLHSVDKFNRHQVAVAHSEGSAATVRLIEEEFGLARVQVQVGFGHADDTPFARVSWLYRVAIEKVLTSHFNLSRSILVLEEGLRFAPDLLWYFAQLEPLLHRDPTLWCVSALNDNGLAPYVADPTVVMRTDWFSGVAWLAPLGILRGEMFPNWPHEHWESIFRAPASRHGRQCLIPEVTRARRSVTMFPQTSFRRSSTKDTPLFRMFLCQQRAVDLGNLDRLMNERYRQLFYADWPGEGLANARALTSIRPLVDGSAGKGGLWRLVIRNSDPESDMSWKVIARYLGLWADVPIRGAYMGVLRLRWHQSVLYLVASSSPFARSSLGVSPIAGTHNPEVFARGVGPAVASHVIDPSDFVNADKPLLLPANGVPLLAPSSGMSCTKVCSGRGLRCFGEDILSLNSCGALARVAKCDVGCKASEGPEQPAQISDLKDSRNGLCLFNTNLLDHPPACDARHKGTKRACVCRRLAGEPTVVHSAPTARPQSLQPAEPREQEQLPAANTSNTSTGSNSSEVNEEQGHASAPTMTPRLPPFASKLERKPSDLAILLITTGRRNEYLRDTLRSLQQADGFNPKQVLVSQDSRSLGSKDIVQNEFGLSWMEFKPLRRGESQEFGKRVASHYRYAIHYALTTHFAGNRSLIVMVDDLKIAPDFLWYFAQLEPLLHRDKSLWCVCAHNENGLAPYVSDPTALMRTDIFPGLAWLVSGQTFLNEILPKWPETRWDKYLASHAGRAGRQCIVPEMPRIRHVSSISEDPDQNPHKAGLRDILMFFHATETLRAVDLGDVSRMLGSKYHEHFISDLRAARLLESIKELPWPINQENADDVRTDGDGSGVAGAKAKKWRLHYQSEDPERDKEWYFVADFFKLRHALPPRGSYGGVIRLRWGAGVLFLVASGASLIPETKLKQLPEESVAPRAFKDGKLPTMLPPRSIVVAAENDLAGMSCTAVCSWHSRECISADLNFINSCDAMRQFVACERCQASMGSDQPALGSRQGGALHGACLMNQDPIMHPPRCEAAHPDTRRLCICRLPIRAALPPPTMSDSVPLEEVSRSNAEPESKISHTPNSVSSATGGPSVDLQEVGWKNDHQTDAWDKGGISSFADPDEPVGKLEVRPSHVAVLVIVAEANVDALRACLEALQRTDRFKAAQALVAISGNNGFENARAMAEAEFGFQTVTHETSGLTASAHRAALYKLALEHAFTTHFNTTRSLVILDETALLSPDALWYFAQLEPLLHQDPSLWCLSTWNDNGIAPYVADVTALLRTDWHPGIAWMLSRNVFVEDLLPTWPKEQLHDFLNLNSVRKGRQCVIPEISRVHIFRPTGSSKEHSLYDEHVLPIFYSEDRHRVFLGDPQRMHQREYEQLLLYSWPSGEGLANSSEISKLASLEHINSGTWRLIVQNSASAWPAVARYLRLWTQMQPVIRCSYMNSIKLRWHGAVLYILMDDSPLLLRANLPVSRSFRGADFPSRPPVLRALDSSIILGRPGQSCSSVCASSVKAENDSPELSRVERRCHDADLLFLNSCTAMKTHGLRGACSLCMQTVGRYQPAVVTVQPDDTAPSIGTCTVNANMAQPPSCEASHPWLARLCVCRPVVAGAIARDPDAAASRTIIPLTISESSSLATRLRELEPAALIDRMLPSQRCGAAFGNKLGPDCAEQDRWCCSSSYECGNSPQHCKSQHSECRRGASPKNFCGGGWTLRLRGLGFEPLA